MSLLGPDGKELAAPAPVEARRAPTRQEKFNMCYMMFTLMTAAERLVLMKTLRPLRRELDVKYPNGMSEDEIKRDIEKQIATTQNKGETNDATVSSVPEKGDNAEPVNPEVGSVESVSCEPEDNQGC